MGGIPILSDIMNAVGNIQGSQAQQQGIGNAQNDIGNGLRNAGNYWSNANQANQGLYSPYIQGGQQSLQQLLQGLQSGAFNGNNFNPSNLANDPGYQFQMQQAQQALQRSAAAGGNLMSGGFMKGLDQYSQGLAAQQYGNAWQRNFQADQANFGNLMGTAGMGFNAASGLAGLNNQYAGARAGLDTNAANAYAGLDVGKGQAMAAGYQNNANDVNGAMGGLGSFASMLSGGGMGGGGGASGYGGPAGSSQPYYGQSQNLNYSQYQPQQGGYSSYFGG